MEIRKESLSALKVCRFCLTRNQPLRSLYGKSNREFGSDSVPLSVKILTCLSVEAFPSDKMPTFICSRCKFFMDLCYQYKTLCRGADEAILKYVQTGSAMEPAEWPVKLSKIHTYGIKIPKMNAVQTVVEGGATVEVMPHDGSDSDCDEEENVYNVKVGEGDNADSACVKVVTSNNSNTNKKAPEDEAQPVTLQPSVSGGCWACDECDRTYPLQQLLELHKMQKHRERTVQCDQCEAIFFSKYDMLKHKVRHTSEMPYQCKECDKRFKHHTLLRRHEKMMHSETSNFKCHRCDSSFYSESSLNQHIADRHKDSNAHMTQCPECDKTVEMRKLQSHIKVAHSQPLDHCCEYCPERFPSVTKLARHVRTHAGVRPYPCKYCEKSFVKSHHYTRHLRQKHSDVRGTNQDPYRCEQCEDTFSSQDNLMYHSAIHATQNLICPLCQEKFSNVDAVTTHIKSHVTGMEYMCDYCELVFTSKEKLDNHLMVVHGDEISESGLNNSSMDCEGEDDEDDSAINVKEEGDQVVLEIKKPDNFMLKPGPTETDDQQDNTCSEESEPETSYLELSTVDTLSIAKPVSKVPTTLPVLSPAPVPVVANPQKPPIIVTMEVVEASAEQPMKIEIQDVTVLRKADQLKPETVLGTPELNTSSQEKKPAKAESTTTGASDKSLKLLEKELQELKRTTRNTNDTPKMPVKPEFPRTRGRPQLHTSTPKTRADDKKSAIQKTPASEKKLPERRAVKENKEPKDGKEKSLKEDKDKTVAKEEKVEKDVKDTESTRTIVKNGSAVKNVNEDGVRRSTRPSKIKDYAKMIRDKSQQSDDDSTDDDEEYVETPIQETRSKTRRGSLKVIPKTGKVTSTPVATKKRGRSRKEPAAEIPAKIKKEDTEEDDDEKFDKMDTDDNKEDSTKKDTNSSTAADKTDNSKPEAESKPQVLMSPSGQTLKKVPVKSLPPGVKPLPLPHPLQISEMQIGKKMVKVQKIVMTKAEVEAMAKKGLVEMKDGTIVLKQGIKIPSDPGAIKSTLVGEDTSKESPAKKEKAAPTRCDLDD